MNKIQLFIISIIASIMILSSCSNEYITDVNPNEPQIDTKNLQENSCSYKVTMSDIDKLIAGKNGCLTRANVQYEVLPIKNGEDTVLFLVNHAHGWELYSADKRFTPLLAFDEKKPLSLDSLSNMQELFLAGMKEIITDINTLEGNCGDASRMRPEWKSISQTSTFSEGERGEENEMEHWLLWSSEEEDKSDSCCHKLSTRWHQNGFYKIYTPMDMERPVLHSAVGCVPVAAGQMLYFLHNKWNYSPAMPDSLSYDADERRNYYYGSSTSIWDRMDENDNDAVAFFLSYIGNILGTTYSWGDSPTNMIYMLSEFPRHFGVSLSKSSWSEDVAVSSLTNGMPFILSIDSETQEDGHAVVVDGYKCKRYLITDTYIYVEDMESFMQQDLEIGEPDAIPVGYQTMTNSYISEHWYFQMNTGWLESDDTYYNLNSLRLKVPGSNVLYTKLKNMYYNFKK